MSTAAGAGLTAAQAASRLTEHGPNTVPAGRPHRLRSLLGKLMGPVPWMLEVAIVLELVVGKTTEAVIVGALLVFNGVLSAVQEGRAADAEQPTPCPPTTRKTSEKPADRRHDHDQFRF